MDIPLPQTDIQESEAERPSVVQHIDTSLQRVSTGPQQLATLCTELPMARFD